MKLEYFEIIGHFTGDVIGVCTREGVEDAASEDPGCQFAVITKKQYDKFMDMDDPWTESIGKPVTLMKRLVITLTK